MGIRNERMSNSLGGNFKNENCKRRVTFSEHHQTRQTVTIDADKVTDLCGFWNLNRQLLSAIKLQKKFIYNVYYISDGGCNNQKFWF